MTELETTVILPVSTDETRNCFKILVKGRVGNPGTVKVIVTLQPSEVGRLFRSTITVKLLQLIQTAEIYCSTC